MLNWIKILIILVPQLASAQYIPSLIGTVSPTAISNLGGVRKYDAEKIGNVDIWDDGCNGDTVVVAGGGEQVVSIVSIKGKCWFAENLNIGTMITGETTQTDNERFEKHCYNDIEDSCDVWGGLYQWDEMMNYSTTEGAQGICPEGWHIPTYSEISELRLIALYNGGKLKETGTRYWNSPNTGAVDKYGLALLGAGNRSASVPVGFGGIFNFGTIWTSYSSGSNWWRMQVQYNSTSIYFSNISNKYKSYSVRCVKDY